MTLSPFEKLGISKNPIILAPLAGVSDHPFRRICSENGADLTYVEMISATALIYNNKKTIDMMERHSEESRLGVQITGKTADDTAQAIEIIDKNHNFDTIDINMGCPVNKVVKTGCGSAILKDPERVFDTIKKAKSATDLPLSAKIRIGWDRTQVNGIEISKAAYEAGIDWISVHGRTRSDDYSIPVDLDVIAAIKKAVPIPVIGNGNIFTKEDSDHMRSLTEVDGVMVSRGALGNPWVFDIIKNSRKDISLEEWEETVERHINYQQSLYGESGKGALCMRKHLLWYSKGWPKGKLLREKMSSVETISECLTLLKEFSRALESEKISSKPIIDFGDDKSQRFSWDPKYQMDRVHDKAIFQE